MLARYDARVTHLRLTHPDLDSWIDVRLRAFDGRWLAVADLADTPDIGVGETAEEALRDALASLGPTLPPEGRRRNPQVDRHRHRRRDGPFDGAT
jgi:hypothetical protein